MNDDQRLKAFERVTGLANQVRGTAAYYQNPGCLEPTMLQEFDRLITLLQQEREAAARELRALGHTPQDTPQDSAQDSAELQNVGRGRLVLKEVVTQLWAEGNHHQALVLQDLAQVLDHGLHLEAVEVLDSRQPRPTDEAAPLLPDKNLKGKDDDTTDV